MANVDFDTSEFENKIGSLLDKVATTSKQAIKNVATEVLHLSSFEVPHDTGNLQNSGHIDDSNPDDVLVGYNTVYAAFQHEGVRADGTHVVTHWQAGRKKKYLEDPIRNNLDRFIEYFDSILK